MQKIKLQVRLCGIGTIFKIQVNFQLFHMELLNQFFLINGYYPIYRQSILFFAYRQDVSGFYKVSGVGAKQQVSVFPPACHGVVKRRRNPKLFRSWEHDCRVQGAAVLERYRLRLEIWEYSFFDYNGPLAGGAYCSGFALRRSPAPTTVYSCFS